MEPMESILFNLVQRLCLLVPQNIHKHSVPPELWNPNHNFKTCFDCGTSFSIFNWRHHCQNCDHFFCGKCSINNTLHGHLDLSIQGGQTGRICKFCFKLKQEFNECNYPNQSIASTQSIVSLTPRSSSLPNLTNSVTSQSFSSLRSSSLPSERTLRQISFPQVSPDTENEFLWEDTQEATSLLHNESIIYDSARKKTRKRETSPNPYDFCTNRSEDDETNSTENPDEGGEGFFGEPRDNQFDKIINEEIKGGDRSEESILKPKGSLSSMCSYEDYEESINESMFLFSEFVQGQGRQYCDIEKNALVWVPPPAEDPYDETGITLICSDDDVDVDDDKNGSVWASLEEKTTTSRYQKRIMRAVVMDHFKVLVAQLLNVEGLCSTENDKDSWLDIVTDLASEASRSIKPDSSTKGPDMDPSRYVKIKCVASGYPNESQVIKGVVCKKNVADRHMSSWHKSPILLLLGGSLEYQRVPSRNPSLETMGLDVENTLTAIIEQEETYVSGVVSEIEKFHPHILLVEKNVSRKVLEKLSSEKITLVQKVPWPILQRIARYTGAEIAPSLELLMQAKPGYCDSFHVDKFVETNKNTGQKVKKTLMIFDGCRNAFGCTILLRGSNMDELKKVKNVIRLAVFAAYHLGLETSFLVDEGASFHEFSLQSSKLESSMSNLFLPSSNSVMSTPFPSFSEMLSSSTSTPDFESLPLEDGAYIPFSTTASIFSSFNSTSNNISWTPETEQSSSQTVDIIGRDYTRESSIRFSDISSSFRTNRDYTRESNISNPMKKSIHDTNLMFHNLLSSMSKDGITTPESMSSIRDSDNINDINELPKDESELRLVCSSLMSSFSSRSHITVEQYPDEQFPSSHSDHQRILVSVTSTCSQKRIVCQMGQLSRINYYGNSDMPLGKFLKDNVFELNKICKRCKEVRDAPILCYTHQQGCLTISVCHQGKILAGEREGKIWMWHRCLKCHHVNGVPPATKRVIMSDAAWGLSFGKFLELSFSDRAAANKAAACGHSLHRDCLRFYGFADIVACFRYSPINVHSVYLPPSKLEFHNPELDGWLLDELDEITNKGTLIFSSALNTLHQLEQTMAKYCISDIPKAKECLLEYEALLKRDLLNLRDTLCKAVPKRQKDCAVYADIFALNSTRRMQAILFLKWRDQFRKTFHSLHKAELDAKSVNLDVRSFITREDINLQIRSVEEQTVIEELFQEVSNNSKDVSVDDSDADDRIHTDLLPKSHSYAQTTYGPDTKTSVDIPESSVDFFENVLSKLSFSNISKVLSYTDTSTYPLLFSNPYAVVQPGGEGRLFFPLGIDDTVVPVYDNEPTSLIAYALMSHQYHTRLQDDALVNDSSGSSMYNTNQQRLPSLSDTLQSEKPYSDHIEHNQGEEIRNAKHSKGPHIKVSFKNTEPYRKLKFKVTCYYAKQFHSLRKNCCFDERDFIRSLCRCKQWAAEGGKSKVFFAKTKDDRFVVKQVTKTEIESFLDFAPQYFNYISESLLSGRATCLGKVLGIFQVTSKHGKGLKKAKMNVLVMENLLYARHINRLYDLKGSKRSRYASGENKVLLDENLTESMATNPIYIEKKAKRILERAIWNDTSFLASLDVMDYSLLVGIDEEHKELVVGIIDYIRQYTWDKHLETWVKGSGILGGRKDRRPTIISPKEYRDRFRQSMKTYFLMVPDQWSPS